MNCGRPLGGRFHRLVNFFLFVRFTLATEKNGSQSIVCDSVFSQLVSGSSALLLLLTNQTP